MTAFSLDVGFVAVMWASCFGLIGACAIERLVRPVPDWRRPWRAWAAHAGLWCVAHALLTALLGRPWFAAAAVLSFVFLVVMINNAKFKSLAEPFTSQDFRYLTAAIRHPRLYIPFLGWGKFVAALCVAVVAVAVGLLGEPVPLQRLSLNGQLGALLVLFVIGAALLVSSMQQQPDARFEPRADVQSLGLFATLWRYALAARPLPRAVSAFAAQQLPNANNSKLPHLVAVQSESFFDPRPLFAGIRPEVLAEFDRLRADAALSGKLQVPAWGANTVRTEFGFLSAIESLDLGVHRFNPFRTVARGWAVSSLAQWLKRAGYRAVCIHPYPVSFYQRDKVYPALGFDEFIDIRSFEGATRCGPYVSDAALTDRVKQVLATADGPVFVFVITMENHGPLHLEQVEPEDAAKLYNQAPPPDCADLTIYLRHLCNADRMVADLRLTLDALPRAASLCWYGDHVPILPTVYARFGSPSGVVDYAVWHNRHVPGREQGGGAAGDTALRVDQLAQAWLSSLQLAGDKEPG